VLKRLQWRCNSDNFSEYQSAWRTGHSTETALLEVLDGVYTSADDKQISVLIGLDLSAAFDTVDHSLLCDRLQSQFGVTDTALDWLRSYLSDRAQYVKIGQHQSDIVRLEVGVPQGSVLGPLLFSVYCSPAAYVITQHKFHQYADDTQLDDHTSMDHMHCGIISSCQSAATSEIVSQVKSSQMRLADAGTLASLPTSS